MVNQEAPGSNGYTIDSGSKVQFRIEAIHLGKVIDILVDSIQTSPLFFPNSAHARFCPNIRTTRGETGARTERLHMAPSILSQLRGEVESGGETFNFRPWEGLPDFFKKNFYCEVVLSSCYAICFECSAK